MLRSLLLALVIVSALLVLLAGASGGLRSLPNPSAMLAAIVTTVTANSAGPSRGDTQSTAVVQSASTPRPAPDLAGGQQPPAAPASQPRPGTLERQVSDLQAQLKERSQELDSLRASQDQVRRDVGTLLQQRQTAMQAPPSPPPQAEAAPPATVGLSPKDPESHRSPPEQPQQQAGPMQQQRATEATLSRLRSQQRQASTAQAVAAPPPVPHVQPPQAQREASQTSLAPPQAYAAQSAPMPPPATNLMTARQLLAYGRTEEARNLLVRLQTQLVLQPVAPDQPAVQGGNMAATRIGDAIRLLDQGNTTRAMQAINIAMASPDVEQSDSGQGWPRHPSAPPSYAYSPFGQR